MSAKKIHLYRYAFLTTFVALLLSIFPMPASWSPWQASWPQLVLIYWCIALPRHFGIKYAWLVGLLIDFLHHEILGQNALLCTLLAYAAILLRQFILYLPVWQQTLLVGALLFLSTSLSVWLKTVIYQAPIGWQSWATVPISLCIWPWVFAILRRLRQRAQLAQS